MEFSSCDTPTVGVEWELQLLDPLTLDLVDGIVPLMEFFPNTTFVKPEYIQSCVELTSCIAKNSDEATRHLEVSLQRILQRCAELEMSVCGAGTHPFCRKLALITPLPRYQRIEKNSGYLAHTQITFSTHVHVGMSSGDAAVRAMSLLIPAIPAFIAMSANSPFWRGHETGHAAYRHRILAAAPSYGLPPRFRDWRTYDKFLGAAQRSGMISHFKDVHWDIRPHPDFGTLELRVMDAASDITTLHGLVAFARSMIECLATAPVDDVAAILPLNLPHWFDKENRYRAAHLGLDAEYIVDEDGRHRPLRDVIANLIEFCRATADRIEETTGLKIAEDTLNRTRPSGDPY
jgi:carboxylate-amine ligase